MNNPASNVDLHAGRVDAPVQPDREPPFSIESEQAILGCVFLAPVETLSECAMKFSDGTRTFYDERHGVLYGVMVEMDTDRTKIDFISLLQRLKDAKKLEAIGGIEYLTELRDKVPSAAHVSTYINIVLEKWTLRKVIITCNETLETVYRGDQPADVILNDFEASVMTVRRGADDDEQSEAKPLVHEVINRLELIHARQGQLDGIATGYPDIDNLTWGLKNKNMIVIAARPSVGKTALAMNIADYVAVELKLPVGVFSLEMAKEELMQRQVCARARVNSRDINRGFFAERDFPKITTAAGRLAAAPLIINDRSGINILQLRARARRMKRKYGIRLFIIDYLQLIHGYSRKAESNRQVEVGEVSKGIKEMAKELDVPVIVLAQLNRDTEKRKTNIPMMSDLRESGDIEADADLIGLLYRKKDDEDDDSRSDSVETFLSIAKQRNGPTGTVSLTFLKQYTKFESLAKIANEDMPQG